MQVIEERWNSLSDKERDAWIGESVMKVEPILSYEILNDTETAFAFTTRTWEEAEKYLTSTLKQYPNSWLKNYHVGAWELYPKYSTDEEAFLAVLEILRQDGWSVTVKFMLDRIPFSLDEGGPHIFKKFSVEATYIRGRAAEVLAEVHKYINTHHFELDDQLPTAICKVALGVAHEA